MDEIKSLSIKALGAKIEELTDSETRQIFEGNICLYIHIYFIISFITTFDNAIIVNTYRYYYMRVSTNEKWRP